MIYNRLGDHHQHDLNEALATILSGIEESLPEHLKYFTPNDTVFVQNMPNSIYSDEYKWDFKMDAHYYHTELKPNGLIDEESNLVTSNFDGIEVISDTCLECGFQRRFFNQFREISMDIHTSYVKCNVIYYDELNKCYKNMNFKMAENSTVEMLKYVALCDLFNYKQSQIYQEYMHQFELIQLNNIKLQSRKHQFDNLASILDSDDTNLVTLSKKMYGKVECILVPVKILQFKRKNKQKNKNKNNMVHVKYIHFQISLKKCHKLSLCVLAVPTGSYTQQEFQHRLFSDKIGLCGEISKQKHKNVKIVSYHNGSLKKYDKDKYYFYDSAKNGIIITYLSKNQTPLDTDKINDDLKCGIDMIRLSLVNKTIDEQIKTIKSNLQDVATYSYKNNSTLDTNVGVINKKNANLFKEANEILYECLQHQQHGYLGHIIDGIDSLWSSKNTKMIFKSQNDWRLKSENLYNLKSCLEEMEEKRYITGEDIMMPSFRCKCKNGIPKLSTSTNK